MSLNSIFIATFPCTFFPALLYHFVKILVNKSKSQQNFNITGSLQHVKICFYQYLCLIYSMSAANSIYIIVLQQLMLFRESAINLNLLKNYAKSNQGPFFARRKSSPNKSLNGKRIEMVDDFCSEQVIALFRVSVVYSKRAFLQISKSYITVNHYNCVSVTQQQVHQKVFISSLLLDKVFCIHLIATVIWEKAITDISSISPLNLNLSEESFL